MKTNLSAIIDGFTGKKIMVIGDILADVYLEGNISRISREAPVLVLEQSKQTLVPGGAGNVVNNAATLGGEVFAVGNIGQDAPGDEMVQVLAAKSIHHDGLYRDPLRPTITKTRIIAGGSATVRQQIVRIDKELKQPLSEEAENHLLSEITSKLPQMDAVIMSDYGSGSITAIVRTKVIGLCQSHNIPCIVDSRYNVLDFSGITFVKQNEAELAAAVGYPLPDEPTLIKAGFELLNRLKARSVIITRGPNGITIFEENGTFSHIPVTNASEVFDVSGAGDTVVATMMLALAAGASRIDAVKLANFAAGIVIRKMGTATTSQPELKQAIEAKS